MLPSTVLYGMAMWMPIVWGQSSSISASASGSGSVSSVSRVATSIVSASTAPSSSSAAATTSTAVKPTILFDRIDTLVACDQAEISWEVFGVRDDQYSVALYAINADTVPATASIVTTSSVSARSVAPSASASSVTPSSTVVASASTPASSAASPSVEPSTSLVGRALRPRQSSSSGNITLTTTQAANEPYAFTVALPAGSYYILARLADPSGTMARSNLFTVIERDNTSCLVASSSSSSTRTSITGGIMQTPGAGSTDASTSSGPSGGAIAGIVIGVVGGLAIIGFLVFFCVRRRRRATGTAFATREMDERDHNDRFAALPSASSQDGQYNPSGAVAAGGRRDSETDDKDVEAANSHDEHYATLDRSFPPSGDREVMTSPSLDLPPALGDRRRQSGPPTTHTLVPKTSMQGIIGKASASSSNESSANHSRSNSAGGTPSPPIATPVREGVTRSASAKRKPVPSMGPELRGEMQREKERKMSESLSGQRKPSVTSEIRRSYSIVPDPLPSQSRE